MNIDWNTDESRGYLDGLKFKAYIIVVQDAIDTLYKRNKRPVAIADLRRELGDDLIDNWLYDALDALMGIGSVVMVSEVSPMRFAPQEIPTRRLLSYSTGPGPVVDKSRPFGSSFTNNRKETF